jgi:predicted RecA/RadA family phage recombinase
MADIAVVTAARVRIVESIQQDTQIAAEAIAAGAPVRYDTNGRFTNANGTSTTEGNVFGIAWNSVVAGQSITAIRQGVLDGWNLDALAYGAAVQLSNTDGRLDSGGAPTVAVRVGMVIPVNAQQLGDVPDKVLLVDIKN